MEMAHRSLMQIKQQIWTLWEDGVFPKMPLVLAFRAAKHRIKEAQTRTAPAANK